MEHCYRCGAPIDEETCRYIAPTLAMANVAPVSDEPLTIHDPICPDCESHGYARGQGQVGPCPRCGGKGRIKAPKQEGAQA